jgi:hypothetical protein
MSVENITKALAALRRALAEHDMHPLALVLSERDVKRLSNLSWQASEAREDELERRLAELGAPPPKRRERPEGRIVTVLGVAIRVEKP